MLQKVRDIYRKYFGTWKYTDPRPTAESAPYTFYLPSENELLAIIPGDIVKVMIESVPESPNWGGERMWVIVTQADGDELAGTLDNYPSDMPQLKYGTHLAFPRNYVIGIDWAEDRKIDPPASPPHRTYWERCLVDSCVVYDGVPVYYLYREEPDMASEGDEYADSGWRIRGEYAKLSKEEIDALPAEYIALGAVLNVDDSWLHLIDEPTGSAFIHDHETGQFLKDDPE